MGDEQLKAGALLAREHAGENRRVRLIDCSIDVFAKIRE